MTIKELEALVGLPRASIRFYEQEGFLSPRRLKNNYRDYSPEDARTLSKIKLLRQLHLDLDSIRRLEAGELTLAQALEDQLSALGEDKAALDRADEVCRSLLRAGTDYAALDPGPWLEELERRPAPSGPHLAEPRDTLNLPGPWRRFFARQLDSALYTLPWLAIRLFVLRSYESYDPLDLSLYPASLLLPYLLSEIVLLTAVPAILTAAVLEPAFLHLLGATPGKWIMGLEVRNRDGNFLTWEQAGARTMGVIFRGEGLYIPLIDLWRNWRSYRTCMDGQVLPWDEGLSYTQKPRGLAWRAPLLAAGLVLCLCAQSVMISVSYALPYPDGLSSPAQLAENYNALCVRRGAGAHGLLLMGSGDWNDGMNRVGERGGESVWLTWFAAHVLDRLAPIVEAEGGSARAAAWRSAAEDLRAAAERARALWEQGGGPVTEHYDLSPGAADLGMVCGGSVDVEFRLRPAREGIPAKNGPPRT